MTLTRLDDTERRLTAPSLEKLRGTHDSGAIEAVRMRVRDGSHQRGRREPLGRQRAGWTGRCRRTDVLRRVVRLDGEPITGVDDLIRRLNAERIGREVKVDVLRRGQLRSFEVHPTERRMKA